MKRIINFLLFAVMAVTFASQANAQTQRQRMTREQFAEMQANNIAKRANIEGPAKEKFVTTYCEFQKELWAIAPRKGRKGNGQEQPTPKERIENNFDRSQKILDLRKKYYKKYSDFLTQEQISKVYKVEKQMMNRLKARRQGGKRK